MVDPEIRELYQALGDHLTARKEEKEIERPKFTASVDALLSKAVVSRAMVAWLRDKLLEQFDFASHLEDIVVFFHNPGVEGAHGEDFAMFEVDQQPDYELLRLENAVKEFCYDSCCGLIGLDLPETVEEEISWRNAVSLLAIFLNPGDEVLTKEGNEAYFDTVGEVSDSYKEGIELLQNWIREFGDATGDRRFLPALVVLQTLKTKLV